MGNIDLARSLIEDLCAAGTDEFCVCAGSRNSPLLAVLAAASGLRLFSFVDERSAAFFAIGRAKLRGRPVGVVTTSGTAVAEMLPAAIEAYYSGLPIALVSADRPARFRGTGAPQTIEQEGIFGVYAESDLARWTRRGPLHLNIEFDEPLIDGDVESIVAAPALSSPPVQGEVSEVSLPEFSRPLVILGALRPNERDQVRTFVEALNAPVYAEPLSGLREDSGLPLIRSGERMIRRGRFDGVIRIGGVPTLRFWRDLEENALPVVHFSSQPYPGLTRGELHPVSALPQRVDARSTDDSFVSLDREMLSKFEGILDAEPRSELAIVRELSRTIPEGARVYLGNSLPIREWDLAGERQTRGFHYEANRGANGIDGQLSTFFGQCDPARRNVGLVGDLTAIYDLGAPWIVPQLDSRFHLFIMNNGGGRIFARVPSLSRLASSMREKVIENAHSIRFDAWASMWGIENSVTELRPDEDASRRVWQRYEELWA
ncbi:MAG TPA: thiamine pyrophosphate-binding protein [Thermoanaerobaculia bacterium]